MNSNSISFLKQYLDSLRVIDLKNIANACDLRIVGKKSDIINRLCDNGERVINLLNNIHNANKSELLPKPNLNLNANSNLKIKRNRKTQFQKKNNIIELENCICHGTPIDSLRQNAEVYTVKCKKCDAIYHNCCVYVDSPELIEIFLCPVCRISNLDPFYPISKILYLLPAWDDPLASANKPGELFMLLSSPNIQELHRKGSEVFIYCIRANNWENNQLHEWPSSATININNHEEIIRKPEYNHVRRDVPIKITPFLTHDRTNQIKLTLNNIESCPNWYVSILLCDRMTIQKIISNVFKNQILLYDQAEAIAKEKMNIFFGNNQQDNDEVGIVKQNFKLKLTDPIMLKKIELPVRGVNCDHLRCFDLVTFLEVTKQTRSFANRWKCLECNKPVKPSNFILDSYQLELLLKTDRDTEMIEFKPDGSWEQLKSDILNESLDDEELANDESVKKSNFDSDELDIIQIDVVDSVRDIVTRFIDDWKKNNVNSDHESISTKKDYLIEEFSQDTKRCNKQAYFLRNNSNMFNPLLDDSINVLSSDNVKNVYNTGSDFNSITITNNQEEEGISSLLSETENISYVGETYKNLNSAPLRIKPFPKPPKPPKQRDNPNYKRQQFSNTSTNSNTAININTGIINNNKPIKGKFMQNKKYQQVNTKQTNLFNNNLQAKYYAKSKIMSKVANFPVFNNCVDETNSMYSNNHNLVLKPPPITPKIFNRINLQYYPNVNFNNDVGNMSNSLYEVAGTNIANNQIPNVINQQLYNQYIMPSNNINPALYNISYKQHPKYINYQPENVHNLNNPPLKPNSKQYSNVPNNIYQNITSSIAPTAYHSDPNLYNNNPYGYIYSIQQNNIERNINTKPPEPK